MAEAKPKHKVRYCLVDSETGLTFHNYFSEEQARESMVRMSGNYHIAQEILDENGIPVTDMTKAEAFNAIVEGMKILGWNKEENNGTV